MASTDYPRLTWIDHLGESQSFELLADQVLIGRKSDSDIVLPSPYVSRHHAKIIQENGGYVLADLDSTHGTFLNGRRVQREVLSAGDRIGLGCEQVEMTFFVSRQEGQESDRADPEAMQTAFMNLTAMMPVATTERSDLEKISLLLDFQYQWGQQFSGDVMFHQILSSALEISGAERGFILRRGDQGLEYARGLDSRLEILSEDDFQTSRSVVDQVSNEGAPVFMTEGISGDFAHQESIVAMNLRAVACLPLKGIGSDEDAVEVLGILYLDSTKTMHALSGLDQKILEKLADEAGNVLEKMGIIQAGQERQIMEQELALARETQVNLLPSEVPDFEGYLIRAFSRPTRHVGGDFYDFFSLKDGRLAGILADVSGKGVSASLLSSSLQGALHIQFLSGARPEDALNQLNKFAFERSQSNRFVTIFFFTLDTQGQGSFISAGHNPAFVFRAADKTVESLASEGLILGAFEFAVYDSHPFQLGRGDILVVYSDGLTDAEDPAGEMYGEDRLVDLISACAHEGVKSLEQKIFQALEEFTLDSDQTDDITFLMVERGEASSYH